MKRNTKILIKTIALVLAFMLLLGVGIMSLSFSHSGVKPNGSNFLTPDLAITAPTSQELLQKKFNAYNTVTEENGKSVLTIFSEEQIKDFNDRRDNGEWFLLSSEEMLFLINNTVELFKTYDIVYIRDLDGNLNKYYGLSFFSSEEYYASFNGFDLGVTDASFDLKKDIYDTIFKRVEVLNSAIYFDQNGKCVFTDIYQSISLERVDSQKFHIPHNNGFANYGIYVFEKNNIAYYNSESYFGVDDRIDVFPYTKLPNTIGTDKYDKQEQTVVIELYEEDTQALIARLRFDKKNNPDIIADIKSLYYNTKNNISGNTSDESNQTNNYRVAVYLNGIDNEGDIGFCYTPDGNPDLYSFTTYDDMFERDYYFIQGGKPLNEYINELLKQNLTK